MPHPWLDSYPEGIPVEVDVHAFDSLASLIDHNCRRHADRPAFTLLGTSLGYRDLGKATQRFAGWLQAHSGLQPGDRVGIMLPNLLSFPVALYGILRSDMIGVTINPAVYAARIAPSIT